MYKRQIYQIAESNLIEKIDSVARIELKLFLPELECSNAERSGVGLVFLCVGRDHDPLQKGFGVRTSGSNEPCDG